MSPKKCLLYLPLEKCISSFNLEKAVCNHGFFMMAPNRWIPSTKSLERPLRLVDQDCSVVVTISHPLQSSNIHIDVHDREVLSLQDEHVILKQVSRMLKISDKDEKVIIDFQELHPKAKEEGFGRIFRSPSLFEDVVKSVLLCCCQWKQTLKMVKSLCDLQLQLTIESGKKKCKAKRKRGQQKATNETIQRIGNFPNSKELAKLDETDLQKHCNLGLRAKYIIQLAKKVEKGTLGLEKLDKEWELMSYRVVYNKLIKLKGFGPFVVSTIFMCMGCYQVVPIDSETKRHLRQVHGVSSSSIVHKTAEKIYEKYAPFHSIAFWFELLQSYEKIYGKLSGLDASNYDKITGSKEVILEENQSKP